MTKSFFLLLCFLHLLSEAKHSCLQQEDFSSRLLPTDEASEIVGLCLNGKPRRLGVFSLRPCSSLKTKYI